MYVYNPQDNRTTLVHRLTVKATEKYYNGLIGVTLDPGFSRNHFIYLFFTTNSGKHYYNTVSRFTLVGDAIDPLTEKTILKIPIDLETSAHTGGSLDWDSEGNLYISTGDNTIPSASNGYAPLDERPGRQIYDAQRTASNTNDLRGKILRIHPETDGSYTIPEGNLFKKGTPGTRPEIYVMGCRNPYRISVDRKNNILYWGDVGPDAGFDSRNGSKGFDEINQAREAGNFGWPYFIADNLAYSDSNFCSGMVGKRFNANDPVNDSRNNSGRLNIPAARTPMIWYPYEQSVHFGVLGEGGRCAMSGPVYHYPSTVSDSALPAHYDNALFVYDWMRNGVFAVHLDDSSRYRYMETFLHSSGDFRRPIDMEIDSMGNLHMLEYGSVYGIDNRDARLVRISYNRGNRQPVARLTISDSSGPAPLTVKLYGGRSVDPDRDSLIYKWSVNGRTIATGSQTQYQFRSPGIYRVELTVTDEMNLNDVDAVSVVVGNTRPIVKILSGSNKSFYFGPKASFEYRVLVTDQEEKQIDPLRIRTFLQYNSDQELNSASMNLRSNAIGNTGEALIAASDCKACHQLNIKSVAPSFVEISRRRGQNNKTIAYLSRKIITGGAGQWGDHAMPAHPQLTMDQTTQMVRYILSLARTTTENGLPSSGRIILDKHHAHPPNGRYLLTASYTDDGNGIAPLTADDRIVLRPMTLGPADADTMYRMERNEEGMYRFYNGSAFMIRNFDFHNIARATIKYALRGTGCKLTVRSTSREGPVLATIDLSHTGSSCAFATSTLDLKRMEDIRDVYFIFNGLQKTSNPIGLVDRMTFEPVKSASIKKIIINESINHFSVIMPLIPWDRSWL